MYRKLEPCFMNFEIETDEIFYHVRKSTDCTCPESETILCSEQLWKKLRGNKGSVESVVVCFLSEMHFEIDLIEGDFEILKTAEMYLCIKFLLGYLYLLTIPFCSQQELLSDVSTF